MNEDCKCFIYFCNSFSFILHNQDEFNSRIDFFRSETSRATSSLLRYVPFRLVSPTGDSVRIERPLKFNSIEDHLDLVYQHFEPRNRSTIEQFVDIFVGDLTTGQFHRFKYRKFSINFH